MSTDAEVIDSALACLKQFIGPTHAAIPYPCGVSRSQWAADPWIRGSYRCTLFHSYHFHLLPVLASYLHQMTAMCASVVRLERSMTSLNPWSSRARQKSRGCCLVASTHTALTIRLCMGPGYRVCGRQIGYLLRTINAFYEIPYLVVMRQSRFSLCACTSLAVLLVAGGLVFRRGGFRWPPRLANAQPQNQANQWRFFGFC